MEIHRQKTVPDGGSREISKNIENVEKLRIGTQKDTPKLPIHLRSKAMNAGSAEIET
jgi:hypothetical protein